MKTAVILEADHYEADQRWKAKVERKLAIFDTVLRHLNHIPLREAMKMTGIKSVQGIHAAADRGELERRYASERKPEFSLPSIIAYLDRKGYTAEGIELQVAS